MNFKKYLETGDEIITELAEELGIVDNRELANRILRAVMHALRSQISREESIKLIEQFPLSIKGIYLQGWNSREKPKKIEHINEFVRQVIHEDRPYGHKDIATAKDGENAVKAVFKVIRRHVTEEEIQNILNALPTELRLLWGEQELG